MTVGSPNAGGAAVRPGTTPADRGTTELSPLHSRTEVARPPPPAIWPPLPATWRGLSPDHVDCVSVRLDQLPDETPGRLRNCLTDDEAAHVDRFVNQDDRVRALVGRAVLRILLARATGCCDPRRVAIEAGPLGKPALPGGPQFNLSHGGDVVLFGFSLTHPVGVDVEPATSGAAWRDVVTRLHPIERAAVRSAPDPAATFLRIWTRKEAVAKAAGFGLSVDPGLWAVSAGHPVVVVPPPGTGTVADWSLFGLAPGAGHFAAVAIEGEAVPRCWTFVP